YNAAVLQITKAWHNPDLKDQRLMHHNGNGIFTLDGERIDSDSRVFVLGNVDSDINHKQKLPCKN
ncbi:MAG: hypothetical protein LBP79_06230, partial [Clostridiales bacterium]|nr:hypothetical protein [Clostridiales bacterium]